MASFAILTGSQMQAIAEANAKADIMKHGKKYGNLHSENHVCKTAKMNGQKQI